MYDRWPTLQRLVEGKGIVVMDEQEQDDLDAAYAQQQGEERRQFEERILARGRRVYEEWLPEVRAWLKEHT